MKEIGLYRVEGEIRRNINSTIFRVQDAMGRPLIAKIHTNEQPDPIDIARFEREFAFLQRIESPFVIKQVDLVKAGHRLCTITEDIGGMDLGMLIKGGGALPTDQFLDYSIKIVEGLQAIHTANLIHRDLNPSNIVVNPKTGQVRIIDLGIASELALEKTSTTANVDDFEGSLPYISPEQTGRMNRDVDYRTDFYSLGLTFYELLAGVPAFQFDDKVAYIHAHIAREPDSLRDIMPSLPPMLSEIIGKLIQKNAENRYQSAYGLLEDLRRCQLEFLSRGEIKSFHIGQYDLLDRFEIPKAVHGRAAEVNKLLSAFERTHQGGTETVLVAGYSGIGKSSLVHEIHKPVTAKRSIYAEGKFGQGESSRPFSALVNALERTLKQVLVSSKDGGREFQHELVKRLGRNSGIINELVPLADALLGKLQVPAMEPSQKKAVTHIALRGLMELVASWYQGYVLFIDDLQWADINTIQFLEHILIDNPVKHFMLICSYRSNEVGPTHPFSHLIEQLRSKVSLEEIHLHALDVHTVTGLVAEALHMDTANVKDLGEIVYQRSQGNPYFIREFLKTFESQGIIQFNYELRRWEWDQEKASKVDVSGDLAEFIAQKMSTLPTHTLDLLKYASFLGHRFSAGDLSEVIGLSPYSIANKLWVAIEQGFLTAMTQEANILRYSSEHAESSDKFSQLAYRFRHDKIQQASYDQVPENDRKTIHLRIARQMGKKTSSTLSPVDIVHHYLIAKDLLDDDKEKIDVARLCLHAAQQAKNSTSFDFAYRTLKEGLGLLSASSIDDAKQIEIQLSLESFELGFLAGRHEDSEEIFSWLLNNAKEENHRLKIYEIRTTQLALLGKLKEAITFGIQSINEFGFKVPYNPGRVATTLRYLGFRWLIRGRTVESLVDLPVMQDPKLFALLRICTFVGISATNTGSKHLFEYLTHLRAEIGIKHGVNHNVIANFMGLAIVMGSKARVWRLREGRKYCQLSLALTQKHPDIVQISRVLSPYAFNVLPWNGDYREYRKALENAKREAIQSADIFNVASSHALLLRIPEDLVYSEIQSNIRKSYETIKSCNVSTSSDYLLITKYFWDRMNDRSVKNLGVNCEVTSTDFIAEKVRRNDNFVLFEYYVTEMKISFLFDEDDDLLKYTKLATSHKVDKSIFRTVVEYKFFSAVSYARRINREFSFKRLRLMWEFKDRLAYFKTYACFNDRNFRHFVSILEAEFARVTNKPAGDVQDLYEKAVHQAEEYSDFWGAVACKLATSWLHDARKTRFSRSYASEALYLFRKIGAQAVIQHIESRYELKPDNLSPDVTNHAHSRQAYPNRTSHRTSSGLTQNAVNFEDLFTSVQKITDETSFDKMLLKFTKVLMEFSGAQKSILFLKDPETLVLHKVLESSIETIENSKWGFEPVTRETSPIQIVYFVERIQKTILLDSAQTDGNFVDDQYVKANDVLSVLCSPIIRANQMVGIVYLENNRIKGAFTTRHENIVQVMAHQAASTIQGALLQQNLEKKVRQKTRDMTTMMQNLKQGIFTIGPGGHISDGFSEYLREIMECRDIQTRNPIELLFNESNVGIDQIAQMRSVISMAGEDRVSFDMNEEHLVRQFRKDFPDGRSKYLEIDWDPIVEEDVIDKIMVTVRDVTELQKIREESEKQKLELEMLAIIERKGKEAISSFLVDFDQLSEQIERVIRSGIRNEQLDFVYRKIHTQKGLARHIGFQSLSNLIHELEEALEAFKLGDSTADLYFDSFTAKKEQVVSAVTKLRSKYDSLYSQTGDSSQAKDTLNIIEKTLRSDRSPSEIVRVLTALIEKPNVTSLQTIIDSVREELMSSAEPQNKEPPIVNLTEGNISINNAFAGRIRGMLIHILQNSLDHGIEDRKLRESKGKPPKGTIRIASQLNEDGLFLEIQDDGQGLDLDSIQMKARRRGLLAEGQYDDITIAHQIYAPGFSIKDKATHTSGRGIGMDAVKATLDEIGGSIDIKFTGDRQEGFRPFCFRIHIPRRAVAGTQAPAAAIAV